MADRLHHEVAQREDKLGLGIGIMALGVTLFTCIDSSAKWLVLAGLPALQVVFVRYAVHFAMSLVLFLPREGMDAIRSNAPVRQALRSACLFGSTLCNFTALQYLPITVTTTIMFSGPIAVTLLSIPILGERVGLPRLIAVCVGFVGVLVVIQPWGAEFHPAMLLNLLAMVLASLYFVLTRMLAGIESNATAQVWSSGLASILLAPVVYSLWTWPENTIDYVVMGLIGIFGGSAHIFVTQAHRLADASILAPIIYFQVLTAALASIVIFGEWPTMWTVVGGAIIIAAGVYIWHRERRQAGITPPPADPRTAR
ncbi:DMT family transporter [Palleronia sp. LCG004]|uniref:DMT family transporter n=1 Tax=Palleronia sp. LCG004 TaxID=3079304 RepID=UPI002942B60F|nr:DMT family transporter [Palleronia sp. LCG004]WOI55388.1 DMT family transporter [Palleronia sp. LCG004]